MSIVYYGYFIILVFSALAYWIIGYPLAFGGNPNVILGTRFWASERFGAKDMTPGVANFSDPNPVYNLNNQDPYIHFFYHYMIAFLVTNIAASAFAERCRVLVYILFSLLMAGMLIFFSLVIACFFSLISYFKVSFIQFCPIGCGEQVVGLATLLAPV